MCEPRRFRRDSASARVPSPPTLRPVFDECVIRGRRLGPARFSAPLAGFSHSAFRRLVGELGGTGAVWTEMLAAKQLVHEDFARSPWVRRRPSDGFTFHQLMVRAGDPLDRVLGRLGEHGVEAVDLNLACDAFSIRASEAGSALFENLEALRWVVTTARQHWPGILTAKIRLGSRHPEWEARLIERLRVIEDAGLDALIVHPRFFEDKFRRRAQLELLPWVASLTRLPLIANGDLGGPADLETRGAPLTAAVGVMIGRMAVAQPWLFASWNGAPAPDPAAVWQRMSHYLEEDFPPVTALRRLRMFTKYFAANYAFGHGFWVEVDNAPDMEGARRCGEAFFARSPQRLNRVVVAGL